MEAELRLIRYAVALAEHGHFARAAESLRLTQPSLSRGIASLERSLGVRLFDRTPRGVVPTAFGKILLEHGVQVLRSQTTLQREIRLLAGLETGSLGISAGPFPSEISVTVAAARVLRMHPRLSVQILSTDPAQVVEDVLSGRVDVGVARVTGLQADARLVTERLPPLRAYLACRPGHPLTRLRRPTLAQALEFPLATNILRGAPAIAVIRRDPFVSDDHRDDPEFVPQVVVNSPSLARLMARESDALAPLAGVLLEDDVAAGRLVKLPIRARALKTVHGVIYLRNRTLAPAAKVFIDELRKVEAELKAAESTGDESSRAPVTKRRRVR